MLTEQQFMDKFLEIFSTEVFIPGNTEYKHIVWSLMTLK